MRSSMLANTAINLLKKTKPGEGFHSASDGAEQKVEFPEK